MILQDINNPSLTKNDSLYAKLVEFCRTNPVSLAEMRGDTQQHHIVEYKYRFAKQIYPEYNYTEIGQILNRAPQTVRFWFTDRTPMELT